MGSEADDARNRAIIAQAELIRRLIERQDQLERNQKALHNAMERILAALAAIAAARAPVVTALKLTAAA
jgi:hypothetical protein